ncbi:hypothetical protein JCM10207_007289 [Rhodosporidiobolus poonsookiae]
MTITKRKPKSRPTAADEAASSSEGQPPTMESGVKATCDSCSADITHTVHVRCAERVGGAQGEGEDGGDEGRLTCPDFDLCVDCFLHGRSLGPHRPTHAYRIISSHSFPIFDRDWGADEELLLIEGAELYGLGNWADIAEHVGGRTKEDCAEHYAKVFLESGEWPLPEIPTLPLSDLDTFPTRKASRLHDLHSRPLQPPPPKPMASAPTCHELGGYMPGRLEFEHEWENDAEVLIKDLEFGRVYRFGGELQPAAPPPPPAATVPGGAAGGAGEGEEEDEDDGAADEKPLPDGQKDGDEPEDELELKMAVLEMFNEKYDKRMAAKELIFDRGLIQYKTMSAAERKRSKEERDLITRTKPFARLQTALDHEEFVDGLLYELHLRQRIAALQSYRRAGITTLSDSERYETARQQRVSSKAAYRDTLALSFGGAGGARRPTPHGNITAQLRARPPPPLTLATAKGMQLLLPVEQQLCATLRILPRPYLFLKEVLLREWVRLKGRMGPREARAAVARRSKAGELLEEDGVQGEWGEKVERVWEAVRDLVGARAPEDVAGMYGLGEEEGEGEDEEMGPPDAGDGGVGTPMQLEA